MSHISDIQKTVLRGVYEDNVGIPRSCHGRLRPGAVVQSQVSRYRSVHPGKGYLIVLVALVTLLGVSFRLVTVDGTGPVAMPIVERQYPENVALPGLASEDIAFAIDNKLPVMLAPVQVLDGTTTTAGQYDTMLARLGMPLADLFNLKVQTIVIDPGHGGIDPGATGQLGLMEKDIALDIAKRLRDKLARDGSYRILLTREKDEKVYLKERVAFAKENHADLFISIHINSLPAQASSLNYVETYYFGPYQDQRSLELAERENRDSNYVMGDFRKVIASIGDTLKTEESRGLANALHRHLYQNMKRSNHDLIDAGSKTGPFMVLLGVDVPSVLIEVSCISNKEEEIRLSMPEYRDSVANFLQTGIIEYLGQRANRRMMEGGNTQNVAKQER